MYLTHHMYINVFIPKLHVPAYASSPYSQNVMAFHIMCDNRERNDISVKARLCLFVSEQTSIQDGGHLGQQDAQKGHCQAVYRASDIKPRSVP